MSLKARKEVLICFCFAFPFSTDVVLCLNKHCQKLEGSTLGPSLASHNTMELVLFAQGSLNMLEHLLESLSGLRGPLLCFKL